MALHVLVHVCKFILNARTVYISLLPPHYPAFTMLKRYASLSSIFYVAALSALLAGCSGSKTEQGQAGDTLSIEAPTTDSLAAPEDQTQDFIQSLPSPIHVARIFNRAGLRYVAGLTNTSKDAGKYQSATAKALNLGIYTTDLAYSTFNNQNQAAVDYFKAVQKMGEGLDMASMFESTNLVPRFERNLGNKDSLLYLMSQLSLESDILLKGSKRMDVVALSFAGAWTESMYLTTSLLTENKNLELYNRVQDQQLTLPKLIALLESQNQPEATPALDGLKEVKSKLDRVVANSASISSTEYVELMSSIKALREKIIKTV